MFGTVTFGKHTVYPEIGREKVEEVIWRIGNLDANKEVRHVVIDYGTNSINKNVPADIVKDVKHAIQLIKCKFYNCKVIVSGILQRDFSSGIRRNKIKMCRRRNEQQQYYIYTRTIHGQHQVVH